MSHKADNELYETRDIQAKPLLIFLSGLTIMCITVFLTTHSYQKQTIQSVVEERGTDHPLADQRQAPGAPLLQAHPTEEIEAHRKKTAALLHSFGWIDRQEGIVHMPIEVAKELFLQRQLRQGK